MLANAVEVFVQVTHEFSSHMLIDVEYSTLAGLFFVAVLSYTFIPMYDLGKLPKPKVCPMFFFRMLLQLPQIDFDPEDHRV